MPRPNDRAKHQEIEQMIPRLNQPGFDLTSEQFIRESRRRYETQPD